MQTLFDAISTILIIGSLTFGLPKAHDFIREKALDFKRYRRADGKIGAYETNK